MIPDDIDIIATEVAALSKSHDYVLTSGGVGPTHDDVTIEAVAKGLGRKLVRHQGMATALKDVYGSKVNEEVLSMADIPVGTELLFGEGVRIPVLVVGNVYVFPGIPELFCSKFDAISKKFEDSPFYLETIYLRIDESRLAGTLRAITREFPDVTVGSYPTWKDPKYRVKVTFEGKTQHTVKDAASSLRNSIPDADLVTSEEATGA